MPIDTAPMEARQVERLPSDNGWQFEPKWDGFRCLAFLESAGVSLRSKSGTDLGRYFPEVVAKLEALDAAGFVLDGELVIPAGDILSFDALQARLHPAKSRVRRLAEETPAVYIVFDMLAKSGSVLLSAPLSLRRKELETFFRGISDPVGLRLSPCTTDPKQAATWLARAGGGELDGVVAKRIDGPYVAGERAMLKVKNLRSADCVVGGFRYASSGRQVGSLLLGLYNDRGLLDHVGFTSGIPVRQRPDLTRLLEGLRGGAGFSGDAPGGPSRWSTERSSEWVPVEPTLVAEVRYDQVTGLRFRHGTKFLRWRPDKAPRQCTKEQLEQSAPSQRLLDTGYVGRLGAISITA